MTHFFFGEPFQLQILTLHGALSQAAGLAVGAISPNSDVALAMFPAIVVLNIVFDVCSADKFLLLARLFFFLIFHFTRLPVAFVLSIVSQNIG